MVYASRKCWSSVWVICEVKCINGVSVPMPCATCHVAASAVCPSNCSYSQAFEADFLLSSGGVAWLVWSRADALGTLCWLTPGTLEVGPYAG